MYFCRDIRVVSKKVPTLIETDFLHDLTVHLHLVIKSLCVNRYVLIVFNMKTGTAINYRYLSIVSALYCTDIPAPQLGQDLALAKSPLP